MSPYFPHKSEMAYRCQGCGGWFLQGNVSCLVAHPPGTCCHYGDTPIPAPDQGVARMKGGPVLGSEPEDAP